MRDPEVGRLGEAIRLYERNLADRERTLGPEHPSALISRNNLAATYRSAGQLGEAIPLFEQNLADREQILGPDHPDTITSQASLELARHHARDPAP